MLTYGRIVAIPIVVGCMFGQSILDGPLWLRWIALAFFIAAAITDFLDGYLARMWDQQSSLGRMLDPIADKLLVSSCLLMLAAEDTIHGWSMFAAIVILCREILGLGLAGISCRVARQRAGDATRQMEDDVTACRRRISDRRRCRRCRLATRSLMIGIMLLWLSALLTIYTGWDYLQAGLQHLSQEDA